MKKITYLFAILLLLGGAALTGCGSSGSKAKTSLVDDGTTGGDNNTTSNDSTSNSDNTTDDDNTNSDDNTTDSDNTTAPSQAGCPDSYLPC